MFIACMSCFQAGSTFNGAICNKVGISSGAESVSQAVFIDTKLQRSSFFLIH